MMHYVSFSFLRRIECNDGQSLFSSLQQTHTISCRHISMITTATTHRKYIFLVIECYFHRTTTAAALSSIQRAYSYQWRDHHGATSNDKMVCTLKSPVSTTFFRRANRVAEDQRLTGRLVRRPVTQSLIVRYAISAPEKGCGQSAYEYQFLKQRASLHQV